MEEHTNQNNHEVVEQEYQASGDDDVDIEEVAVAAYNRIDALVELMIKKGMITETELDLMEDSLVDEEGNLEDSEM
jgi:hypothetical protein